MKEFPYEDIVHLPHHVSKTHPQMPRADRAAQFAPFAALSGHAAAIGETARLTDYEWEFGEEETGHRMNQFFNYDKERKDYNEKCRGSSKGKQSRGNDFKGI